MATTRRTVVLSVQDDFSRQLRQFAAEMEQAETATEDFGRSAGSASGGFGRAVFQMNQLFGATQLVKGAFDEVIGTAREFADIGVQAQRSEMALDALAGSAQEADKWIEAIKDASLGSITTGEAAAQAYQLMRFGLADSAAAAEEFVRSVSVVAAVNPQLGSTSEAINEIQLTLSNMSFMRLDQLGISAGEVRARIKELQEANKDLTREEAFQIAVMEEISEQADILGDDIVKLTSSQDQLSAKFREFKEGAGAQINTSLEEISGNLLDVIEYVEELANLSLTEIVIKIGVDIADEAKEFLTGGDAPVSERGWSEEQILGETWEQEVQNAAQSFSRELNSQFDKELAIMIGEGGYLGNLIPQFQRGGMDVLTGIIDPEMEAWLREQTPIGAQAGEAYWTAYYAAQQRAAIGVTPSERGQFTGRWGTIDTTVNTKQSLNQITNPLMMGGDYYRAQQEAGGQAALAARRRAYFDQIRGRQQFGFLGQGGLDESAMFMPDVQMPQIATPEQLQTVGGLGTAFSNLAGSLVEMAGSIDIVSATFGSLDEKFGVAATSFDTDVFSRMSESLRDVGVEGDAAAQAIQAYQLATGMATGESEVFDIMLEDLSQQLADGTVSATDYTLAVSELARADLSGISGVVDALIKDGDVETALNYLNALRELDSLEFESIRTTTQAADIFAFELGGEVPEFQPEEELGKGEGGGLSNAITQTGELTNKVNELSTAWIEGQVSFEQASMLYEQNLAAMSEASAGFVESTTGEFVAFESSVSQSLVSSFARGSEAAAALDSQIDAIDGKSIEVLVGFRTDMSTLDVPGSGVPDEGFADGGYTGAGASTEAAGIVHKGEYVVPANGALVIREGGGGANGGVMEIRVPVMIDGQVVAEAVERVANSQGRTSQVPMWNADRRS
jgi:hypothetical protein